MSSILVAEDEPRIAAFIDKGLRADGFGVTVVGTAWPPVTRPSSGTTTSSHSTSGSRPRRLRRAGRAARDGLADAGGVLTARDGIADTVAGLEGGAEPFRFGGAAGAGP